MKIKRAILQRERADVETDLGNISVQGKIYFLQAGVALAHLDGRQATTEFHVPGVKYDGSMYPDKVVPGTTDPQLVCIARRALTLQNTPGANEGDDIPVPTPEEAKAELHSGKVFHFDEPWQVPRLVAIPAEESFKD